MAKKKIAPRRETISPEQYRNANKAFLWFAQVVCDRLNDEHKHLEFELNPTIALNVAVATYDDIDRFKAYHLRNAKGDRTVRSDAVKRAAYFVKWITKLNPISFRPLGKPKADPGSMALMANEALAASYALELIGSELKKHLKYSDAMYANLLYDLHYRELGEDALLALFQVILDLAKSEAIDSVIELAVIK